MARLKSENVLQINHKELIEEIIRCYETKEPLFIQGGIGIGKSYSVRYAGKILAKRLGLPYLEHKVPNLFPNHFVVTDIRLAQKDAGEVLGLPDNYALIRVRNRVQLIPVKSLNIFLANLKDYEILDYLTKWGIPSWFPRSGHGIIFLDEFNLAAPLIQHAAYELINDRTLGDYTLPEGYIVIGAGNRGAIDGAPTFRFADPLNDRFSWYELKVPKTEEWTEWAIQNRIDPRIISFLQVRRSYLYNHQANKLKVFATPRSWERASIKIKGISQLDKIFLHLAGRVGEGIAREFIGFLQLKDKLRPIEEYIENPHLAPIPSIEKEVDLLFLLCASITEYYLAHLEDPKQAFNILESITIFASRLPMEFTVYLLKLTKFADKKFFMENIGNVPAYNKLYRKIGKYLIDIEDLE